MNDFYQQPSGLSYIEKYITEETEKELAQQIEHNDWRDDLKRRVQHYGYRYDYKARSVSQNDYLGELPDWLNSLATRLVGEDIFSEHPDQVIVNEYQPGQGIAPHVDCVPCFDNTIASLSLLSSCEMTFRNKVQPDHKSNLYLRPRSLLVLKDKSRLDWTHGIAPRKSDMINGLRTLRARRLSLTFRKVII